MNVNVNVWQLRTSNGPKKPKGSKESAFHHSSITRRVRAALRGLGTLSISRRGRRRLLLARRRFPGRYAAYSSLPHSLPDSETKDEERAIGRDVGHCKRARALSLRCCCVRAAGRLTPDDWLIPDRPLCRRTRKRADGPSTGICSPPWL